MTQTQTQLTGSEKQIEWAEKIVAAKMPEIEATKAKCEAYLVRIAAMTPEQLVGKEAMAAKAKVENERNLAILNRMQTRTDCGFWIDYRNMPVVTILAHMISGEIK